MAEDCAEGNVDEAMHLWTLTSSRKWQLEPPIHRTFTWCGVDMPMLIDTGSPVCVVPREIYEKNWERWPPLQPSGVKLSCYLGKLPVLGQLDMKVAYKGAVVECPLIVLNCPGPSLCGRDLLFQLSNAGSPILHMTAEDGSPTSLPAADDIANEFQDVFSAELGCISGPPVHLQLKEGATPKFYHQPLLGLLKADKPTPALAAARIQRWALYLGGFRYKLQYSPGKLLLNADPLSRLPLHTPEPPARSEPPEYVHALASFDDGTVSVEELKQLTAQDVLLTKVVEYTKHGWPTHVKDAGLGPFSERRLELSVAHGLVYWGHRVVVPTQARERVLHMLHETHQGSSAMKAVARSAFWWPGLDREIEHLSASCHNCVQNLPMPASAQPISWPAVKEKWSRLHADFAGPVAGSMILVVVDAATKWIEAVPMRQASTSSTIASLRSIFARFGVPRTIVTDNGTQFTSEEFAIFAKNNNIAHLRTAVYHPQSNGLAERAVRTIKEALKKMSEGTLEEKLVKVLFNYRRTPCHEGKSPSELLFGYLIRSRLDSCFPPFPGSTQETEEWTLPPDTAVYARNYGQGEKWTPGKVQSTTGSRMVTIQTPTGVVRRHIDQVRSRPSPASARSGVRDQDEGSPSAAAAPAPTDNEGDLNKQPTDQVAPAQASPPIQKAQEPPQALRRSTRERKPVQRLQY
ncbi:uncharacterized protein LOC121834249 [Ixodes scapularis]|uniref:uncharacterized protein LOC121834249 n=1 Tax=Ixodes scapularis TaxID=6945 RepID=UPI001C382E69|nr:uncharacterized protein LOC121834249 [Ixodes scapularis]